MDAQHTLYTLIGGLLTILIGVVGWFVAREVRRKDSLEENLKNLEDTMRRDLTDITNRFSTELRQITDRNTIAIEHLTRSISDLSLTMESHRTFLAENYVNKRDHEKDVEVIHSRISNQNKKLDNLSCPSPDCPMR